MAGDGSNFYGYRPSMAVGIVFLVLNSLLSIVYLAQSFCTFKRRPQLWWTCFIVIGGICEIMGWAGRIAANINPDGLNQFLMQQVLLILGPCFYSATLYGILGAIMVYISPENPLIKPKWLAPVFICADIISIAIQAAGGGQAGSSAGDGETPSTSATWTMAAGVIFQLVVMIIFTLLALYLWYRHRADPKWRQMKLLCFGSLAASLMIILRGFFRSIELGEGWVGHLYTHEGYLIGLDAVPMVLCLIFLVVSHPTWSLPRLDDKDDPMTVEREASETSAVEKKA